MIVWILTVVVIKTDFWDHVKIDSAAKAYVSAEVCLEHRKKTIEKLTDKYDSFYVECEKNEVEK